MSRLTWDHRSVQAGVSRCALYPQSGQPVAWSGVRSLSITPEAPTAIDIYLEGQKVGTGGVERPVGGKLQAVTYPDILDELNQTFDMSFTTGLYGAHGFAGYAVHLMYNVQLRPGDLDYNTQGDSPNLALFSWDFTTMPVDVPGQAPTSHMHLYADEAWVTAFEALLDVLHGTELEDGRMPTPKEVIDLVDSKAVYYILDHGDGTWTASGPDTAFIAVNADQFTLDWPTVAYLDANTYNIWSY